MLEQFTTGTRQQKYEEKQAKKMQKGQSWIESHPAAAAQDKLGFQPPAGLVEKTTFTSTSNNIVKKSSRMRRQRENKTKARQLSVKADACNSVDKDKAVAALIARGAA
jgi:hypothetical protein